jgi:hypothetical protein
VDFVATSRQSRGVVDERPQPEPLLDRPVRSLLDLRIGTVLKAYAVYLMIAFAFGVLALIIALVLWNHSSTATREAGTLSWDTGAGHVITAASYRSIGRGARLEAVRSRFGEPATSGANPFDLVSGETQTCLGYRSSGSDSALFLFCFEGGRLVEKKSL